MVQGTASHVGKSLITAALCRIFADMGHRVAPFKSQNMALNSSVTSDGSEIGRAQAFQALAAGIEPTVDMNPILLKPTGDSVSQVIVHGRVYGQMSAREYHAFKPEAARFVMESFERLSQEYDVIVIEGAGSPAEINLRRGDIVNMGLAEMTDSPVILVGDIDRGGVFASLLGTVELLTEKERERVKGLIINKFRGDIGLLTPGIEEMEGRIGKPFIGVLPYLSGLTLPDEDGVAIERSNRRSSEERTSEKDAPGAQVKVAVIRLPRISNFTDFDPLKAMAGVELEFIDSLRGGGAESAGDLAGFDLVIIPGTKNVIGDLLWLEGEGFGEALKGYVADGGMVIGICGGFQMLGKSVSDPYGVESGEGAEARAGEAVPALGLLDMETMLTSDKKTFRVRADAQGLLATTAGIKAGAGAHSELSSISGYEIHMGETLSEEAPFAVITERSGNGVSVNDGAISGCGRVMGTYIHGLFDNDALREAFILSVAGGGGRARGDTATSGVSGRAPVTSFEAVVEASIKKLSETVKASVDMARIYDIMGF